MAVTLHYRKYWLGVGWLLVAMIVFMTLTPRPQDLMFGLKVWDKYLHTLGYFAMMGWFVQIYHARQQRLLLAIVLVLLGVMLEFMQYLGGVRYMEVQDMIANGLGVVIAWLLSYTPFARLLYWVDQRLPH
jgi:VanZ family protein